MFFYFYLDMGRKDGGKEKFDFYFDMDGKKGNISKSEQEVLDCFSGFEFETEELYKLHLRMSQTIWMGAGLKIDKGHVEKLYLKRQKLIALPENFGNFKFLKNLDLSSNGLTTLPESFGNLESLKTLNLANNPISSLPNNFGNLKSLEFLSLSWSNLISLPESFGNLSSLKSLKILDDNLTSLPESFGNLRSLKNLELVGNPLVTFPKNFGNLESLESLYIEGGNLTFLPESFRKLTNLQWIHLECVPLRSLSNMPEHLFQWDRMNIEIDLTPKGTQLQFESRYNELYEYYRKSPSLLAKEYVSDPSSLTEDEIERLIHEASKKEEELIESKLSIDDYILRKFIERDSHWLSNGTKILL